MAASAYLAATYLPAHNARFAVAPQVAADARLPLAAVLGAILGRRPLEEVLCLETERTLGRDWVVRYENQGLQVTPTRAAQRHVAPGRRVLVRESAAGVLTLVVVSPVDGREQRLAWTPVGVAARRVVPPVVAP